MSGNDKITISGRRCSSCGSELPSTPTPDLCPKCLLLAGFRTEPNMGDSPALPRPAQASKGLPEAGEHFGHYHLLRPLGQGGMGVVYEAEDLESGRRIALKVLSQALDSPEARKRFLREGQLAASINHPNCVYVFGTEEIAGTPVIAMELLPGGTLQDRVAAAGPLPVTQAVDCALQIIAGLEAAQQLGILHRDIKPSNCFVDTDGTVKIGDFGLSIGTGVRTEPDLTATGTLFGTPAFSSPEQLRGEELTVRSDVYAVGVTLYYLLTGRKPFEAANVVQLLAIVLDRRAESPAKWRPGIPAGLGRAVLRCLEKDPRERFGSYAKLREALLLYTTAAATPATLARRFLAGCIDLVPISFAVSAALHGWHATVICDGLLLLYFGVLEGIWGATVGKLLLHLRVVRVGENRPDLGRAFLRAALFVALTVVSEDLISEFVLGIKESGPDTFSQGVWAIMLSPVLLALTFSTARGSNGFAAIHDWLSGTRVVLKAPRVVRPETAASSGAPPDIAASPQIGPYHLLQKLDESLGAELLLAYDTCLLRKVWIRRLAPGAPPVPPELRNLARPTRLRWLNSRRSAAEAWDAYQAVEGQPLLDVITAKQSWASVWFWLTDLAAELDTALRDDSTLAVLRLDRLWLSANGRLVLLDFPIYTGGDSAPVNPSPAQISTPSETPPAPGDFLRQVALSSLQGRALTLSESRQATLDLPLPLHARSFVDALGAETSPGDAVRRLKPLFSKHTVISRARRSALFAGVMALPILLAVAALVAPPDESANTSDAIAVAWIVGIVIVILPCWLAALCFRGGLMLRGLGIAVVTRQGRLASRPRLLWRNLVATLPFLVLPGVVVAAGIDRKAGWTGWVLLGLLAALTLISLLLPRRSLQDRLAGTFLVPR